MNNVLPTSTEERRETFFERSKKTSGLAFATYRNSVMSEKEKKLGEKIVENFKEAYQAKERAGVFKAMAIAEKYWSGEFEIESANTNFINANIETQVADLFDQNIDVEPKPYDPSDEPYVSRVRQIADKIVEINKMPLKLQKIIRRFKTFGHTWVQVLFNPKLLEGMGCPEITSVSSAEIFPDPAITDSEDINKGRFFIRAKPATIAWAEKQFGMKKASAIYGGYRPYGQEQLNFGKEIDTTGERYLHIFYWTKYIDDSGKERLRLIQCSGCGVILKDSLDFEKEKGIAIFPTTNEDVRYPFWLVNDMERENSIWGKSNASLLYSLQDTADELDNAILANARLVGNPQKIITTSSGIDPDKIDNAEGEIIISNTADGYRSVEPPSMPAYIINRRNEIIQTERMIVSRVSDQQAGLQQHGVDTATESLALQNNSAKSIDATKAILQIALADIIMYCIELAVEYWNEDMFFANNENGFDHFVPTQLQNIPVLHPATTAYQNAFKAMHPDADVPVYMEKTDERGNVKTRKIHVILSVSVGAGVPKNKAFMYNIINEAFAKGAMSKQEYREKLKEYVGLPYNEDDLVDTQASDNSFTRAGQTDILNEGVSPQAVQKLEEQRNGGIRNVTK